MTFKCPICLTSAIIEQDLFIECPFCKLKFRKKTIELIQFKDVPEIKQKK